MFSMDNDADIVMPTYTARGYIWPSPVGSGIRLNPNVGSIRQLTWGDSSNYNSLQTRLRRKFAHGFQLQGAFTWQKSIDGYSSSVFPTQFQNSTSTLFINRHLNRGLSDFNVGRVATVRRICGSFQESERHRGPLRLWPTDGRWGAFSRSATACRLHR